MNVIIAPHPDDELIGCHSLIVKGDISKVIYVDRVPIERMEEAKDVCSHFNMTWCFLDRAVERLFTLDPLDTYYIPSVLDNSPLHRLVFGIMKHTFSNIVVYSTYMNDWFIRPVALPLVKRGCLDSFYPSQKDMWAFEHKYFLYEGMVKLL